RRGGPVARALHPAPPPCVEGRPEEGSMQGAIPPPRRRLAAPPCRDVHTPAQMRYSCGMSPAQQRYLVLEQGVGAAIVNFVFNAGIAALFFYGQTHVPLWGAQCIAGDTLGTTFILPFITCLVVTRIARGQMRGGRPIGLGWTP